MKKNILTIIIMAIVLINTILTAVLIFAIVPSANKTTKLVDKVASIINLELESPESGEEEIAFSDIMTHDIADKLTITLDGYDGKPHFAVFYVSLSMNSKHKDYESYSTKVGENEIAIKEIIDEEFTKYKSEEINANKNAIKQQVLIRVQELFKSDFIINVSFGNIILQ